MVPDPSPVTVVVPGTCGELVQGWYGPWDEPVLVSCPIARYSHVTTWLNAEATIDAPDDYFKARQAARLVLDHLDRTDWGARIRITSSLLPSRGMASSTADVVGVMAGLAVLLQAPLPDSQMAHLACQVEPSDSTMFAGPALLGYRGSGRSEALGLLPPLALLMLDPGLTIDTLTYNIHLDLAAVRKLDWTTQIALDILKRGIQNNDLKAIGAAATLSATSYQVVHNNPLIPVAQAWAIATRALGLVRAHSGSMVGLLFPPETDLAEPAAWLATRFSGEIIPTAVTNAGPVVLEAKSSAMAGLRSESTAV